MGYVLVVIVWLAVGAAVGLVEARHGHWRKLWVISALAGPLAIAMAVQAHRLAPPAPVVLTHGEVLAGQVDVLVGIDGSRASMAAAEVAVRLLGPRLRRVTLATVLDIDTAAPHAESALYPEPWPEEVAARNHLAAAIASLRAATGHEAGSAVLAGPPAEALERYALDEGYEVIAVGCRGRGLSKRMLGSCASGLAARTTVPVLLIPAAGAEAGDVDDAASGGSAGR